MCKKRVGTWARRKKPHELINQVMWTKIKTAFPEKVALKEAGVEEDLDELEELFPCVATHQYAEKGQIRAEFETEIERRAEEVRERHKEEEEASKKLIESLVQEEKSALASQTTPVRRIPQKKSTPKAQQRTLDMFVTTPKRVAESNVSNCDTRDKEPKAEVVKVEVHESKENSEPQPGPSRVRPISIDGAEFSQEEMDEQLKALEALERLKKDEELAKALQEEDERPKQPLSQSKVSGNNVLFKRKSAPNLSQSPAAKKMRQMSLSETFSQSSKL